MSVVEYEVTRGAARITINRPEQRNALSDEVFDELISSMNKAKQDARVRVVVLAGAGDRGAAAGAGAAVVPLPEAPVALVLRVAPACCEPGGR